MRTVVNCLFVVVTLAFPALAADPGREGPAKNVILFGWDGAQREHIQQCLERGELPTLKMLSGEGALVDIDIVTGATDTKAGWSQILTGYHPEVTGVYSNGRYHDIPKGLSVFERLKDHFGPEKFVCVAVIGKSGHCGEIKPPFKKRLDEKAEAEKPAKAGKGKRPAKQRGGKIVEEDGVKYLVFGGSPYYTMHQSCEVWEYDGRNWRQINIDGFGNPNNEDIKFIIYKNYLYAYSDDEVWRWSSNKRQVNMPWIPSLLLDD